MRLSSIEFCAGAGGQALGLEKSGFDHKLLVDNDRDCCATLKLNRPNWRVEHADMATFDASEFKGVDLFAGGLPCPPFSLAGKQLGEDDERNLFPSAFRLIEQVEPKFVLIENVKGLLSPRFEGYREKLASEFEALGFKSKIKLLNASSYGVSQLRPRVAIVAAREKYWRFFDFPRPFRRSPKTVGEKLFDLMAERGWSEASVWAQQANEIAPTIVGGSKKHGGPDLGPTRARAAWLKLGVNGKSIAELAPERDATDIPRLTPRMVARIQGFPDTWQFSGKKTAAYRQIGNAFPPPVARVLGNRIRAAILAEDRGLDIVSASIAAE